MSHPRSVLYVPASRPAMLARASERGADALLVDLEDGVPPRDKPAARDGVRAWRDAGAGHGASDFMLRVNAPRTPWHEQDLALARSCRPARVVIPKAEDPHEVRALAENLAREGIGSALMIETARGVASARDLAGCHPRVEMLLLGSADLRLSLQAREDPERGWERHALSEILLAARMHERAAIDGVYFRFRDRAGLVAHARIARDLGYDGKTCIHPEQIGPVHEVYASTEDEIRWARGVLAAWNEGGGHAMGIVEHEGEMIEALHATLAARILARA